jgi:hypothetical protein
MSAPTPDIEAAFGPFAYWAGVYRQRGYWPRPTSSASFEGPTVVRPRIADATFGDRNKLCALPLRDFVLLLINRPLRYDSKHQSHTSVDVS